MERVCEELDEAKAEIQNLRAEHKAKAELCESLKRAHNDQLAKTQEANAKIEKQAQELNEKADEISTTKQMYEELKSSMKEKEAIINRLSSTTDKLRVNCDEKLRKWEEEQRELVVALDEANSKNMDHEQKLDSSKEEVKGLKCLLSDLEKKCLEAEKKAKASKELRQRDDMLLKQEEENRKVEDQLKWKKEQFKHLEEAHEKLRGQFQTSKKEWEVEKSMLLDEISTLQTNLDSQTRISKDLQSRLQMCNQALSHEESRRKYLEAQLSETKTWSDNVFTKCEEAKSKIECLTSQRDKDIANLRDLLGTKEMIHKEMKYQVGKLEEENHELRFALKEMQEARIQEGGNSSSLSKIRNKLKGLEQMHRDCSKNLKAKEDEWTSELEKLTGDLSDYRSELESKDTTIKELETELEGHRSLLMDLELQNEEKSLMLMLLKSGILEAQLNLANEMADMDLKNRKREEGVSLLMKQLEIKSASLVKAQKTIAEDREKMACLLGNVESLSLIEEQQLHLKDELERHKEMLMHFELQNEEKSLMLFILKLVISEAQMNLANKLSDIDLKSSEREKEVSLLTKQLEMKNDALVKAETNIKEGHEKIESLLSKIESLSLMEQQQLHLEDELERHKEREDEVSLLAKQLEMKSDALVEAETKIKEGHEKMESLLSKVESFSLIEEQQLQLEDELERHKEMLQESSGCQTRLKEQVLQMESDLKRVHDDLKRANDELAEKFCEGNELEFKLQVWKSIAERLEANLEENQQLRKQVEASLIAEVGVEVSLKQDKESLGCAIEERERRIDDLERQLVVLDTTPKTRETGSGTDASMANKEIECLEQECVRRELEGEIIAHINAERLLEERDQRIDDLNQRLMSMEERLKSSTTSFNLLLKAWEKIATDEVLKELEIQEKTLVIAEMESDCNFSNLERKLKTLQQAFSRSKEEGEEIAAELKAKRLEIKTLTSDLRTSVTIIDKLESEKGNLIEDVKKLLSDRERLLDFIGVMSERISKFSDEDMQLMGVWERIVQRFGKKGRERDLKGDDELFDPLKENMTVLPSPTTKRVDATVDERSPLRARNS